MNRDQLNHVLRAASGVVPGADILVIGSQALLAIGDEAELPVEATRSIEVDIAFFDDTDDEMADAIDGAIGELSRFHETFGYYGQGVSVSTAVLSDGWQPRLIELEAPTPMVRVRVLEAHDCVVSKLVADREKDRAFASALIRAGVVDRATLVDRVALLPATVSVARRAAIADWLRRSL